MLALLLTVVTLGTQQPPGAAALADSARSGVEAGVARTDLAAVEAALALVDRALAVWPGDALLRHYRAYALYRAGALALGRDGAARARPYFEQARGELESLTAGATIPESWALLSAVYGMQIATSRVSMVAGMRLGPKASGQMERAVEAGHGKDDMAATIQASRA